MALSRGRWHARVRGGPVEIRLWDLKTAMLRRTRFRGAARILAFSPDGKLLASTGRATRLWRVQDGARLRTLETGADTRAIAFSPDGSLLATAGFDQRIRLWDVAGPDSRVAA